MTAYDQTNGRGNVLSTGVTPQLIVPAVGAVHVALTLGAAVAKIVLALKHRQGTIGNAATIRLDVAAFDADGNMLIGGTPFAQPIRLTTSDPVNGTVSQAMLTEASTNDPTGFPATPILTVRYSGANVLHIVFSATGATLQQVTPAELVLLAAPPAGQQIIVAGDPYNSPASAYSTGGQFLGTLGSLIPYLYGTAIAPYKP